MLIISYGTQLWGTVSTSNIEILERFQSKALRIIVDAPWNVPNSHIRRDLQMTSVKEEICRYSNHIALVSPHIQICRYSYQYRTRLTSITNIPLQLPI
jgi:hypothetical protein